MKSLRRLNVAKTAQMIYSKNFIFKLTEIDKTPPYLCPICIKSVAGTFCLLKIGRMRDFIWRLILLDWLFDIFGDGDN